MGQVGQVVVVGQVGVVVVVVVGVPRIKLPECIAKGRRAPSL